MKWKKWGLAGAAVLVTLIATSGVIVMSGVAPAAPTAQAAPANTATVEKVKRNTRVLAGAAVLVALAVTGGVAVRSSAKPATAGRRRTSRRWKRDNSRPWSP